VPKQHWLLGRKLKEWWSTNMAFMETIKKHCYFRELRHVSHLHLTCETLSMKINTYLEHCNSMHLHKTICLRVFQEIYRSRNLIVSCHSYCSSSSTNWWLVGTLSKIKGVRVFLVTYQSWTLLKIFWNSIVTCHRHCFTGSSNVRLLCSLSK
jgi:hypothetical protein